MPTYPSNGSIYTIQSTQPIITTEVVYTTITSCSGSVTHVQGNYTSVEVVPTLSTIEITSTQVVCTKCTTPSTSVSVPSVIATTISVSNTVQSVVVSQRYTQILNEIHSKLTPLIVSLLQTPPLNLLQLQVSCPAVCRPGSNLPAAKTTLIPTASVMILTSPRMCKSVSAHGPITKTKSNRLFHTLLVFVLPTFPTTRVSSPTSPQPSRFSRLLRLATLDKMPQLPRVARLQDLLLQ